MYIIKDLEKRASLERTPASLNHLVLKGFYPMARSYSVTSRVLLSTFDGAELAVSIVAKSDRLAAILRVVAQVAPAGYRYSETIA